jgi:hypothetical protein
MRISAGATIAANNGTLLGLNSENNNNWISYLI